MPTAYMETPQKNEVGKAYMETPQKKEVGKAPNVITQTQNQNAKANTQPDIQPDTFELLDNFMYMLLKLPFLAECCLHQKSTGTMDNASKLFFQALETSFGNTNTDGNTDGNTNTNDVSRCIRMLHEVVSIKINETSKAGLHVPYNFFEKIISILTDNIPEVKSRLFPEMVCHSKCNFCSHTSSNKFLCSIYEFDNSGYIQGHFNLIQNTVANVSNFNESKFCSKCLLKPRGKAMQKGHAMSNKVGCLGSLEYLFFSLPKELKVSDSSLWFQSLGDPQCHWMKFASLDTNLFHWHRFAT